LPNGINREKRFSPGMRAPVRAPPGEKPIGPRPPPAPPPSEPPGRVAENIKPRPRKKNHRRGGSRPGRPAPGPPPGIGESAGSAQRSQTTWPPPRREEGARKDPIQPPPKARSSPTQVFWENRQRTILFDDVFSDADFFPEPGEEPSGPHIPESKAPVHAPMQTRGKKNARPRNAAPSRPAAWRAHRRVPSEGPKPPVFLGPGPTGRFLPPRSAPGPGSPPPSFYRTLPPWWTGPRRPREARSNKGKPFG